jgi:hypothetical protein
MIKTCNVDAHVISKDDLFFFVRAEFELRQQKEQEASTHPSRPAAAAYINIYIYIYIYIDTGRHGTPHRSRQVAETGRVGPGFPQAGSAEAGRSTRDTPARFLQVDTTSLPKGSPVLMWDE